MQAKTKTTLAELNVGDRFYFVRDKKRIAYQVTNSAHNINSFNQTSINGWMWKFDLIRPGNTAVVFLRSVLN